MQADRSIGASDCRFDIIAVIGWVKGKPCRWWQLDKLRGKTRCCLHPLGRWHRSSAQIEWLRQPCNDKFLSRKGERTRAVCDWGNFQNGYVTLATVETERWCQLPAHCSKYCGVPEVKHQSHCASSRKCSGRLPQSRPALPGSALLHLCSAGLRHWKRNVGSGKAELHEGDKQKTNTCLCKTSLKNSGTKRSDREDTTSGNLIMRSYCTIVCCVSLAFWDCTSRKFTPMNLRKIKKALRQNMHHIFIIRFGKGLLSCRK